MLPNEKNPFFYSTHNTHTGNHLEKIIFQIGLKGNRTYRSASAKSANQWATKVISAKIQIGYHHLQILEFANETNSN